MEDKLVYNIALERLRLDSFRCFGELEVQFDEKLTVFIAENGGGKTTILDALAEGLKAYLAHLKVKGYKQDKILSRDVKVGQLAARVDLVTDVTFAHTEIYKNEQEQMIAELHKDETLVTFSITTNQKIEKEEQNLFFEKAEPFYKHSDANLPVLAYYGGDSVAVDYKTKEKTSFDRLDMVYKNALNPARFDFTPFYNWYKHSEDIALRTADKQSPDFLTIDSMLSKIKTAIEIILNDVTDTLTYSNLRLNNKLLMGMDKKQADGGVQFIEISQFSAGEKALFAFVADLGLRLLHATPLEKRQDAKDVVEDDTIGVIRGKGIVLIDEVDLHLHPKWQRKIVGKLQQIFPEVQFIMTTHSPSILSNLYSKHILSISDGNIYGVRDTFGHDDADDMLYLMGVESPLRQKIQTIHRLLRVNHIAEAKTIRNTIVTEGTFPPLLEIDMFIQRKERLAI
jgi:predicted ATP-binding protein involved in virulence